jgi:hypothetical protein
MGWMMVVMLGSFMVGVNWREEVERQGAASWRRDVIRVIVLVLVLCLGLHRVCLKLLVPGFPNVPGLRQDEF